MEQNNIRPHRFVTSIPNFTKNTMTSHSLTCIHREHCTWGFYFKTDYIVSPSGFKELFLDGQQLSPVVTSYRYTISIWHHKSQNVPIPPIASIQNKLKLKLFHTKHPQHILGWKRIDQHCHVLSFVTPISDTRYHGTMITEDKTNKLVGMFFSPSFDVDPYILPIDIILSIKHPMCTNSVIPLLYPITKKTCTSDDTQDVINQSFRHIDINLEIGIPTIIKDNYTIVPIKPIHVNTISITPLVDFCGHLLGPNEDGRPISIKYTKPCHQNTILSSPDAFITRLDDHFIDTFGQLVFILKVEQHCKTIFQLSWSDGTKEYIENKNMPIEFWWTQYITARMRNHFNNDPCLF